MLLYIANTYLSLRLVKAEVRSYSYCLFGSCCPYYSWLAIVLLQNFVKADALFQFRSPEIAYEWLHLNSSSALNPCFICYNSLLSKKVPHNIASWVDIGSNDLLSLINT
jgi:hypothetical protein